MRHVHLLVLAALAAAIGLVAQVGGAAPAATISLAPLGTYGAGPTDGDAGTAEIPAHDPNTQRLFVVNAQQQRVDVLDISTPSAPDLIGSIALPGVPNSVDVSRDVLAVAVQNDRTTENGWAVLYPTLCDPASCAPLNTIEVGALPDMLTFSPNGRFLLVANEGEALVDASDEDNPVIVDDPRGTVSVIDLRQGAARPIVRAVDFTSLDGGPTPPGMILDPSREASRDVEPEYITVSTNNRTAWVVLQEANAIAEIDVAAAKLVAVRGLGFKDHGLARNSLDASDREVGSNAGVVNMCTWENLFGVYQPDGIASYRVRNRYYVVTANEGDSRDGTLTDGGGEDGDERRIRALPSGAVTPTFGELARENFNLGRLTVNRNLGVNAAGVYEGLYAYGARSFAIWRDDGQLVYDSGNDFERIIASFPAQDEPTDPYSDPLVLNGPIVPPAPEPAGCPLSEPVAEAAPRTTPANSNHDEGPSFDNRSDNKGPEPEGITLGQIRGNTYAFVGLERAGGIMVYDISDPAAPTFVQYVNPRSFAAEYVLPDEPGDASDAGDLGPEGIVFISGGDSPTGQPLLVVANEVSGTTTIYAIDRT